MALQCESGPPPSPGPALAGLALSANDLEAYFKEKSIRKALPSPHTPKAQTSLRPPHFRLPLVWHKQAPKTSLSTQVLGLLLPTPFPFTSVFDASLSNSSFPSA